MPFQTIKTRRSKSGKIDIFPKGLTHGFGPKMAIFSTFFFRQYRQGKCVLRYSKTKNAFLGYRKQKFKKAKNCHFFNFFILGNIGLENVFYDILERKDAFSKGVNPWLWSKNGHFFNFFFFQAKKAWKMSLTTIQNEKTPFQAIITRSLKSRKIAIFLKGLTHGFGPKMVIFLTSFFQAIQPRIMSLTIFQNKRTPF